MKSERKHDWLMFLLVIPFALFGSIIIWIGAKDIEEHKQEQVDTTYVDTTTAERINLNY